MPGKAPGSSQLWEVGCTRLCRVACHCPPELCPRTLVSSQLNFLQAFKCVSASPPAALLTHFLSTLGWKRRPKSGACDLVCDSPPPAQIFWKRKLGLGQPGLFPQESKF